MNKLDRYKHIHTIMRRAWSSLESHIAAIERRDRDGDKWHEECIQEYVDIINAARHLY